MEVNWHHSWELRLWYNLFLVLPNLFTPHLGYWDLRLASPIFLVCSSKCWAHMFLCWHLAYTSYFLIFVFPLSHSLLLFHLFFFLLFLSLSSLSINFLKCFCLRIKVGQGCLCPRNMLRLIQFARACRSCKYLWALEKKLTQAHKLKELGRGMVKQQWPQMSLPGRQVQLATSASLLGWNMAGGRKSILAPGAVEIFFLPFLYPGPISNYQSVGVFRDQL